MTLSLLAPKGVEIIVAVGNTAKVQPNFTIRGVINPPAPTLPLRRAALSNKEVGRVFLRATLIAAAIAVTTVGWPSPTHAQSPIAAVVTTPSSPVISLDDQCGDGWEWSKTAGRCIPVPTVASTAPQGATFLCVDGTYSFSKTSQGACSRNGGIKAPVGH